MSHMVRGMARQTQHHVIALECNTGVPHLQFNELRSTVSNH